MGLGLGLGNSEYCEQVLIFEDNFFPDIIEEEELFQTYAE